MAKTKEELNTQTEKFHELNDVDLEKVSGGDKLIGHISCTNPNCDNYRRHFFLGAGAYCTKCGWPMEWVDEGFIVEF